jgi:hypothetical protein
MRRIIGLVAGGLGTFFIVVALLMHFVVVGQALKFPLGLYKILTYQGSGVSYFNPVSLSEVSGASVRLTQTLRGDVSAGTSKVSVWDQFTNLYDTTNHQQVQYAQSRLAFDRHTGVLLNCCGAAVGTNMHISFAGQGVEFPMNAKKQTYNVFDTTLLKSVPAQYAGQTTVDGLTANKYVETVSPTQVGTKSLPGSLVGSKAPQVTLGEFYQTTTTYTVDPTTGTIVGLDQNQHIGLRDSTGAEKLVVFNGDLSMTPATVQSQVNTAKSGDTATSLITTTIPLTAGLIGVVLLVLGIVLLLMSRGESEEYAEEE